MKLDDMALPILGTQTGPGLAGAVTNLVYAKRVLDGNGWNSVSSILGGVLPGRLGTEPAWPSEVMRVVLPFLNLDIVPGSQLSALIPVAQTIGMNCKWSARTVSANDRERLVKHLTDPQRASPNDFECSTTIWIRQLGIFMASEGKNRVAFLAGEGIEFMPSLVHAVDYPSADRLQVFEVSDRCERRVFCTLDGELLVPLESPSWSLPLLTAYGVRLDGWPDEHPSVEAVCAQLRSRVPDDQKRLHPISLSALKAQLAFEDSEPQPDTLIHHEHIRFRPRPLALPLGSVSALLLTAGAWPEAWQVEGLILAFCMGVISCVSVFLSLPLVEVRPELHRLLLRSRRSETWRRKWRTSQRSIRNTL